MRGDTNFVNNHFWNCYEEVTDASTGAVDVVVEAVAATGDYLDTYVLSIDYWVCFKWGGVECGNQ